MIHKAYKYRLNPTAEQKKVLSQHFGAVRFVYNWGVEIQRKTWKDEGRVIGWQELSNRLTAFKKDGNKDWLKNPARCFFTEALQNLNSACQGFFNGKGFPQFKTKTEKQALTFPQDSRREPRVDFTSQCIAIPKVGQVKCTISRHFKGVLKRITISKTPTGKYFASCLVEVDINPATKSEPIESDAIGIDLGIKHFATLSTGETIDNPRFLNKSLKALRRASRKHSKKKKGSKNREKSRIKLARLHEKVANQRLDFLHKTSTKLIRENQTVCIEDLNVAGMVRNRTLARHLIDVGFGTFRELIKYKANWYGKNLLVIDRFAPSSKQCSCGVKNTELKLRHRTWTCSSCGMTHDRDLLAAQNIVKFAFHPDLISK